MRADAVFPLDFKSLKGDMVLLLDLLLNLISLLKSTIMISSFKASIQAQTQYQIVCYYFYTILRMPNTFSHVTSSI